MRHRGHRASDKRDNLARQANGRAAPCALIWLGTVERHCIGAWGCRSFCFPISPRSYEIRQPCLAEKRHRHLGTSGQERRRRDRGSAACSDAIGDYRLICGDVVRGHVLDGDLLLASASVVVEPFRQQHDRPRCLVCQLQIFRPRLEILRWLCPSPRPRPTADYR